MVETWALRIAKAIKRIEPNKTASVEILKFSLEFLINTLITFFIILSIGIVTGAFVETMIGLGAFMALRFFSGGMHFKKAIHCSLLSTFLISLAPHIPLTEQWTTGIIIGSLALILIFAPSNIEGHARIPSKYFPILKFIAAAMVAANFFWISSTVALVHFIQAASTITLKRR